MPRSDTPTKGRRRRKPASAQAAELRLPGWRDLLRLAGRALLAFFTLILLFVLVFAVINPPVTLTMLSERWRTGPLDRAWVDLEDVAPVYARAVVAAEDANFCLHWGFDMAAIRQALDHGANRGASTITQQVVKNVFLWQGRSWPRKALEAVITPVVELVWTKRRILEVYVNVAEMGDGVFGVEAAAGAAFGKTAAELSPAEAARLAAVLPDPRARSAGHPGPVVRARARQILAGAATIAADGRADCFQD
jgi:monofunctional biosynthetic peptidoglycan transglycosylase